MCVIAFNLGATVAAAVHFAIIERGARQYPTHADTANVVSDRVL